MTTPLHDHRKKLGVTSRSVALAVGIEPSHYRRIEIGEATPSPAFADRIAKHFGDVVTRDQILFPEYYPESGKKPSRARAPQLQKAS